MAPTFLNTSVNDGTGMNINYTLIQFSFHELHAGRSN